MIFVVRVIACLACACAIALWSRTPVVSAQPQARRVLVVVDQGSLPRASAAFTGAAVDRIVASLRIDATVETVVVSGEQSLRTAAVSQSLAGTRGFFDDLSDGTVDRARHVAEQSLRSVARAIAQSCTTPGACAVVALVTPGTAALTTPERPLREIDKAIRASRAMLTVIQVQDDAARALEPAALRTNGIEALVKAMSATVVSIAPGQDAAIASVTRALEEWLQAPRKPGRATISASASASSRSSASASTSSTDALTQLIERAASHVRSFVEAATVLVADEHYVQELKARNGSTSVPSNGIFGITVERRVLDSEVALVHIIDRQLWMIGRDVLAVDNRKVDDAHRVPLTSYHPSSIAEAVSYFQELANQGARYNIGRMTRNLNVPTLALWFLTDGIRERFTFSLSGSETIDGQACRVVQYRERKNPYLLRGDGRPVRARGRYWIEPDTGRVRKTELVLFDEDGRDRIDSDAGRAMITARYAYTANVDAWVPIEMQERYDYPKMMNADFIVGQAEYKNYRRFQTSSRILPQR